MPGLATQMAGRWHSDTPGTCRAVISNRGNSVPQGTPREQYPDTCPGIPGGQGRSWFAGARGREAAGHSSTRAGRIPRHCPLTAPPPSSRERVRGAHAEEERQEAAPECLEGARGRRVPGEPGDWHRKGPFLGTACHGPSGTLSAGARRNSGPSLASGKAEKGPPGLEL